MSHFPPRGLVDPTNSSSSLLAASAVFTGSAFDVSDYSTITVLVDADVDSARDGVSLEFSPNGVDWVRSKKATLIGGENQAHSLGVVSQFYRTVYTNGASAQGAFNIQTRYHTTQPRDLTSGSRQILEKWDDTTLVRSVGDPFNDINTELVSYQKTVQKFGKSLTIGTTEQEVWPGSSQFSYLTAASPLQVAAGGDPLDASAGNNARSITLEGLDDNFLEISETIELNGSVASVATSNLFCRLNRAYVEDVGTYNATNAGEIIIQSTAGNIVAIINASAGQTQQAIYTVPTNYDAYLLAFTVEVSEPISANVRMVQRQSADNSTPPVKAFRTVTEVDDFTGYGTRVFRAYPGPFPGGTDLVWLATRSTGGSNARIVVNFDLLLIENDS
jgi:hypothetical protein